MKKILPIFIALFVAAVALPGCNDSDDDNYDDWRELNDAWLKELQARRNPDGTPYYKTVVPVWNPGAYVLIHYFNDRAETADNLTPLYTSVVDVIYKGYDCEGEPFDSSMTATAYGRKGVQRFQCNATIQGWAIALEDMHVGDTAEVIVPYAMAYGSTGGGVIKPYSTLRFNMRLYDIYRYEANPY